MKIEKCEQPCLPVSLGKAIEALILAASNKPVFIGENSISHWENYFSG